MAGHERETYLGRVRRLSWIGTSETAQLPDGCLKSEQDTTPLRHLCFRLDRGQKLLTARARSDPRYLLQNLLLLSCGFGADVALP